MDLFKILFSGLFGAFFCLLVLVPFVLYTYGILPAVFVGLCALLVLCLLAFCSWQHDYMHKTDLAFHVICQEMTEIRGMTHKLNDKYNRQQAEILKSYENLLQAISHCQKKMNGRLNSAGDGPAAGNIQQSSSVKFQSATGVIQQTGSAKDHMLSGIGHTGSIKSLPTSGAVQTASSRKSYSVKVEIKKNSGTLPILYIYRDGAGAFRLTGRELLPAGMQEGYLLGKSQIDAMMAYDMLDLFEVNSSKLLNHKIMKIEPAQIARKCDFEISSSFEVVLLKKGSIEVDNPVI